MKFGENIASQITPEWRKQCKFFFTIFKLLLSLKLIGSYRFVIILYASYPYHKIGTYKAIQSTEIFEIFFQNN